MTLRRKIIFSLVIVAALFAVLETGARTFDWIAGIDPETRMVTRLGKYVSHPFMNVALRPGVQEANPLGFRGREIEVPKPEGRVRIVCIGGSTTWGYRLPLADTYPAQLEKILRGKFPGRDIEVVNAGVPIHNSLSSLVNLQCRVLPLEPDIVCVYHGVNDMWPMMTGPFKTDYSHFSRDFPEDRSFDSAAGRSAFIKFLELSRLFQILRYRMTKYYKKQDIAYYAIKAPRATWAKAPAVSAEALENYERNLRSIVAVARAHGAAVVFGTFAFRDSKVPKKTHAECYEKMNRAVKAVGEKLDVPVADVRPAVADDEKLFAGDDMHLSAEGSKIQAEKFADAIAAGGL